MTKKPRDISLDVAKGIAIILVIVGHTLQGMREDFDSLFAFRLVYSFHMPLFIFLSGAVAATKLSLVMPVEFDAGWQARQTMKAIGRAAARLLVPFISWTILGWYIGWYFGHSVRPLGEWLFMVLQHTDNSLWFLVTIFMCLSLLHIWCFVIGYVCHFLRRKKYDRVVGYLAQAYVSLLLFLYVAYKILLLPSVTSLYGIGAVKINLIYFIFGAIYYLYGRPYLRWWVWVLACVSFAALVPFWDRLHPGALSQWLGQIRYVGVGRVDLPYRVVTACSGIVIVLGIVKAIVQMKNNYVKNFLVYCSVASLGIYAMQNYFLGYQPKVVAPLLYCLAAYTVLVRIPIVSPLLLGEKHRPWRK